MSDQPVPDRPADQPAVVPTLTAAQRKTLRGRAHELEPVVWLGRAGLSDSSSAEIERAIAHHELIKVKVGAERDERKRIVEEIPSRVPCAVVGAIGQVAILYRPHRDPEKRRFRI
jgi:RNA-binding protein